MRFCRLATERFSTFATSARRVVRSEGVRGRTTAFDSVISRSSATGELNAHIRGPNLRIRGAPVSDMPQHYRRRRTRNPTFDQGTVANSSDSRSSDWNAVLRLDGAAGVEH